MRRTRIPPEPPFLLGCGRSGTTHLHNLLWRDYRFAVLSNDQVATQPFALMGRLYRALDLPGFNAMLPEFERYLAEVGQYEKNRFDYPSEVVLAVNRCWVFAFDEFGCDRIESEV